ncbi:hypothetical protein HanIR_Chr13g0665771 [Helianthus annuus]|nr:hypothetical protein HanIR_Chr13g0665771 [Helianthus annuus]
MGGSRLAAAAVVNGECSATRVAEMMESAAIWVKLKRLLVLI